MTERVLVIEADVVLGAVVAEVLQHSGYEVTFVRTLIGEIDHIDSVSAVILDIDTTAAERELAWLKLLRPCYESLPIVLMGVQVPEDLTQRLRSHSVHLQSKNLSWVQKPFRNEELLTAVRQAQEGCLSGQAIGTSITGLVEEARHVERKEKPLRCERCAGLVVAEHASVGATSIGSWASAEWRCVNCGAVGVSRPTDAHPGMGSRGGNETVGGQRCSPNTARRRS